MTFAEIQQLWIQNGGTPGWAPLMAGIALAESGGTTKALNNNPSTGDYSVGLWQINYYGDLLSGRTAAYGSPVQLQNDPNRQAQAAVSLFGTGAGISNWTNDRTWNAWRAAGSPSKPPASTVQSWVQSGGISGGTPTTGSGNGSTYGTTYVTHPTAKTVGLPWWTGAGAIQGLLTTTGKSPPGETGGGQAGAPYRPSMVPGVPALPPAFPTTTANPVNELSRVLAWGTEFAAWGFFILIVALFGILLLALGIIALVFVLARPVAAPVAEIAGIAGVGKLAGRAAGKASGGGSNPLAAGGSRASAAASAPLPASSANQRKVEALPPSYRESQRQTRQAWLATRGPNAGASVDAKPGTATRRPRVTQTPAAPTSKRAAAYKAQTGRPSLTPKQSKRTRQKAGRASKRAA